MAWSADVKQKQVLLLLLLFNYQLLSKCLLENSRLVSILLKVIIVVAEGQFQINLNT